MPLPFPQARLYNQQYRANRFDVGGPTDVVQRLTGKVPDDFETIVRRYLAASSYGMPSWRGRVAALSKFMGIPLQATPGAAELAALNR